MGKKRKLRSSEPEATIKAPKPEPEPEPEPPVQEEEPQSEPIREEEEQPQPQEQQDNMVLDDSKVEYEREETQQQQLVGVGLGEEDEEEEEEEEEEGEEEEEEGGGQEQHETLDTSNDAVPSEAQTVTNGAAEEEGEEEEEEEVDDEEESVEQLLEPFSKEQLVALVKKGVDKYPDLIESVRELADADPAHRKIFVHGLGWDTTAETLTSVFGKYGEIEDCKAVTDRVSGKSKGYAFILFKHRSGSRKALKQPQKKIGNRTTSCQLASAGPVPAPPPLTPPVSEYTQRKIFVSNVSADIDPAKLLQFFKQFGEIEDGPLGIDKQTGKPKGFALFVYKSVESARKALEEPHKNFEGHTLHCQRAIDGPKPSNKPYHHQQQHQHQHHHHPHPNPHPNPHPHHYHSRKEKNKYSSGGTGAVPGHLMAPSGPTVGFNPGAPGLNPMLGQALSTLLASQGAGLGLGNLLGGLGGAPVNQAAGPPPTAGYGNQAAAAGSYGNQPVMQGGYQNPQMGQSSAPRPHLGGGAPYMGH